VTAVTVYRFFQEALLNVVKHADVDDAEAVFACRSGLRRPPTVRDNGPGFDPEQVRSDHGPARGVSACLARTRRGSSAGRWT